MYNSSGNPAVTYVLPPAPDPPEPVVMPCLADYHVHSRISPDGSDSMTALAEAALEKDLDEICFTDHMEPLAWGVLTPRPSYDWDALLEEFKAAEDALGDAITLRLGIELGDACWDFAHTKKLLASAPPLDFFIGSVHLLSEKFRNVDLYDFDPKDEAEAYEGIADYLGQVHRLVEWGTFDTLGHLTLPLRYLNENRGWNLSFDRFEDQMADIFKMLIDQNISLELNTNRGGLPLPDKQWLELYRRLGGALVTLGSDAHSAKDLGRGIEEGQALLRACGFTEFVTYENHMQISHRL